MKIVHITFTDFGGGAAIAAYRLHRAMLKNGVDSRMLVARKGTENGKETEAFDSKWDKLKIYAARVYESRRLAQYRPYTGNFSLGTGKLHAECHPWVKEADVVYLHWVNDGLLSCREIGEILKLQKPVFWFMHDMWAVTGGCHHSFDCQKYQMDCGACPLLRSSDPKDISSQVLKNKLRYWKNCANLHFLAPSRWMRDCAVKSRVGHLQTIDIIPNSLDINLFKPVQKAVARGILNLPQDKRLLLFGADMGTQNPYKGWAYLREALKKAENEEWEMVIFGGAFTQGLEEIPMKAHGIGRLNDVYSLVLLYSACDIFLMPSLAEAFGQTALEALACGTPVVGFETGGIPDIVRHLKTGYLARYKDSEDLYRGILWGLNRSDELRETCRTSVLNFDSRQVVYQHLEVCRKYLLHE